LNQQQKNKKGKIEKLSNDEAMYSYFSSLPGSYYYEKPKNIICRKIDEIIDVINKRKNKE